MKFQYVILFLIILSIRLSAQNEISLLDIDKSSQYLLLTGDQVLVVYKKSRNYQEYS